ncbi:MULTISPECIES: hypothetical protein [unclassified Exiguobacterium]|uniref:hypothetical protein n=1 Tax=unclassified Exiguobacterium TaxID=2644629 RepID=UPI001BE8D02E|nr:MULTISPECIES: hypothetical protein [unclassified Exiguobacterium]
MKWRTAGKRPGMIRLWEPELTDRRVFYGLFSVHCHCLICEISAEMDTPEEDYESASKHLFEAFDKFPEHSIFFALGVYLESTFVYPVLDEAKIEEIESMLNKMDAKSKGILYYSMANLHEFEHPEQYESYLLKAITEYPEFPRYYLCLGRYYISNDNIEKGKLYVREGLLRVKECLNESSLHDFEISLYSFIDEEIGGLYMFEESYQEYKEMCS